MNDSPRIDQTSSEHTMEVATTARVPKQKWTIENSETQIKIDRYCWFCHTEGEDELCVTCHRNFHTRCLKNKNLSLNEEKDCPVCHVKSVDGTELTPNRFFECKNLKKLLDVAIRRSFDNKKGRNSIFWKWPRTRIDKLLKVIDFEVLLDKMSYYLYARPAELYSDVHTIVHNTIIVYGVNSDEVKAAESLKKDFQKELLNLEACPECYFYLYCDDSDDSFVRLCESPHDIVWAQLPTHSYWPAKCLKVTKGFAHVRFFGEHEQSKIPINKCLHLSKSHPMNINSRLTSLNNAGPKGSRYNDANAELLKYIQIYELKYGPFPYYPHKTAYKKKN